MAAGWAHPEPTVPAPTTRAGLAAYFRPPVSIDAVWLAAAPFVLVVAALLTPIRPFDYFWSLVQGRAIVQLGQIPSQNLFLHTLPPEAPFFDQPWLGQLAMYSAFRLGGHFANVLLLAASLAAAVIITIDTAVRAGARPRNVGVVALAVVPILAFASGARTQMFAYPCFAFVLRQAVLRDPRPRLRSLLPAALVAALWANLHGSFVLAPLLFVLPALGALLRSKEARSRRARWGWLLREVALIGLATLLNPHGPLVYVYAFTMVFSMRLGSVGEVGEWLAPSPLTIQGAAFYALVLVGVALAVRHRRRARLEALLPCVFFAIAAATSKRLVGWWALSAIVALAPAQSDAPPEERRLGSSWPNVGLLALFVAAVFACLPGAPLFERAALHSHLPYAEARALGVETPWRTVKTLARGYPGQLFHTQAVGGLVEWILAADRPRPVAFVDQRFELIPPGLWRDYFAICGAEPGWQGLLARHRIGTLLVDEEDAALLLTQLSESREWRLVGQEYRYRLYVRAASPVP
jgi:hypothetical protein